jgi:hypothetical protein
VTRKFDSGPLGRQNDPKHTFHTQLQLKNVERKTRKPRLFNKLLEQLDVQAAVLGHTAALTVARSNVRDTIREVFGATSPEFHEHEHIDIWVGPILSAADAGSLVQGRERGRIRAIGILNGLIGRLEEKRADLLTGASPAPSTYFDRLNLHPRILDVTRDLFMDGHHWDAVFAGSKALLNYIKERSGRHDLDGAQLVRTVFSRSNPVLKFNGLANQTDMDEQGNDASV